MKRQNLQNICSLKYHDFKIVYNGIDGYKSKIGFDLRERILQEINVTSHNKGTLSLKQYFSDNLYSWGISYFDFDDENNKCLFDFLNEEDAYLKYAADIEKL